MSGLGVIYSFTVVRRGAGPYRDVAPYALAYVELAEGPRIMTNIVTPDPAALVIGQGVRVRFDRAGDTDAVFRFEPV
jgi:hypothetical protein